jgi:enoyl-CoA hydratase
MTVGVRVEVSGPVTTVVLDRPEARNAVDRSTAQALAEAFLAFDADEAQAVAVLTGAGGTFCAGADLKAMDNRIEADGDGPMGPTRLRLGKPVVAAVEGYAVAGGLELALWCDLRVAAEDATFGVFCRRWGVPLIDGGTVRLPRLIGTSRAMDLILTGRPVDAAEAERIGLVADVVDDERLLERALEGAEQIAAWAPWATRLTKQGMWTALEVPQQAAVEYEDRQQIMAIHGQAPPEAINAFLEKREAKFAD